MKIFALSDLHLAFAVSRKDMAVFGEHWADHPSRIARAWKAKVGPEDVVLIAGDISWAMRLEDAESDLRFIASLPGIKIMIRGNHDYWWSSPKKIRTVLPEGMHILHNDALNLGKVAIAGSRLWVDHDLPSIRLPLRTETGAGSRKPEKAGLMEMVCEGEREKDEKIFKRELNRLTLSMGMMDPEAELRIAMVHYPPLSTDLAGSRTTKLLEEAGIDHCVFGHLHNHAPSPGRAFYGSRNSVTYHMTSCDYLDFIPALVAEANDS
jgi:predicted phosphohydrolase